MTSTDLVPSRRNQHGKIFEKKIAEAFHGLHLQLPIEFRRVLDSASAGNFIRAAEGDFELTVASTEFGKPFRFRIECKSSDQFTEFSKCFRSLIKPHQNAAMRLAERAGICGVYLFWSVEMEWMEVWSGTLIAENYPHKRKPLIGQPAITVSKKNLHIWASSVCHDPQAFLDSLVRSAQ